MCDRYLASSVAYGEAQGLDPRMARDMQKLPAAACARCCCSISRRMRRCSARQLARDRYERDLALLGRVRESYLRQAAQPSWQRIDGQRPQGRGGRSGVQRGTDATRAAVSARTSRGARRFQHAAHTPRASRRSSSHRQRAPGSRASDAPSRSASARARPMRGQTRPQRCADARPPASPACGLVVRNRRSTCTDGNTQPAREIGRLIEAALPLAPGMQRHGNNGICVARGSRRTFGHHRRERGAVERRP